MLTEEGKALRPCGFCFNNCFVNAYSTNAEGELTAWGSQLKEEKNSMGIFDPWNRGINLIESVLYQKNPIQEKEPQIQNWGLQHEEIQRNEARKYFLSLGTDLELPKEKLVIES